MRHIVEEDKFAVDYSSLVQVVYHHFVVVKVGYDLDSTLKDDHHVGHMGVLVNDELSWKVLFDLHIIDQLFNPTERGEVDPFNSIQKLLDEVQLRVPIVVRVNLETLKQQGVVRGQRSPSALIDDPKACIVATYHGRSPSTFVQNSKLAEEVTLCEEFPRLMLFKVVVSD